MEPRGRDDSILCAGYALTWIVNFTEPLERERDGFARLCLVRGFFSQRLSKRVRAHVHRRARRERERLRCERAQLEAGGVGARFVLWTGAAFGATRETRIEGHGSRSESRLCGTCTTGGQGGQG